jgi:hypothetical protein
MNLLATVLPHGTYILNSTVHVEVLHGQQASSLAVGSCFMTIEGVKEEPKGVFHVVCVLAGEPREYVLEPLFKKGPS